MAAVQSSTYQIIYIYIFHLCLSPLFCHYPILWWKCEKWINDRHVTSYFTRFGICAIVLNGEIGESSDVKSIPESIDLPIYNNLNLQTLYVAVVFLSFFLFRWDFNQLGLEEEQQHNLDANVDNDTHRPPPRAHPIQAVRVSLHLAAATAEFEFLLSVVVRECNLYACFVVDIILNCVVLQFFVFVCAKATNTINFKLLSQNIKFLSACNPYVTNITPSFIAILVKKKSHSFPFLFHIGCII